MDRQYIREYLLQHSEKQFLEFSTPILQEENYPLLGVRIPEIRKLARELASEKGLKGYDIVDAQYYEEVLLKGFVIGYSKQPLAEKKEYIEDYLTMAESWGLIDSFVSTFHFRKGESELMWQWLQQWKNTDRPFVIRFVLVMMLNRFLDDSHIDEIIEYAVSLNSDHYYVEMAQAWLLATAAINYYGKVKEVLPLLNVFTCNRTIQKAIESYRITSDRKEELRKLRRK